MPLTALFTKPPGKKKGSPKRQTVKITLWVKPVIKREIQRLAEEKGLSISATGAALLEYMLQHNLQSQHQALLDPIIGNAIGKHIRSFSTRIAVLLVRVAYASEQTRGLVTTMLRRQPGMTPELFNSILDGASNAAKGKITYQSPQLQSIIEAVEQWFIQTEETTAHAG